MPIIDGNESQFPVRGHVENAAAPAPAAPAPQHAPPHSYPKPPAAPSHRNADTDNTLVTIHRQALHVFFGNDHSSTTSRLHSTASNPAVQQQQQQLARLQQQRTLLATLVQETKARQATTTTRTTIQDELRSRKRRAELWKDRPYLQVWKKQQTKYNISNNQQQPQPSQLQPQPLSRDQKESFSSTENIAHQAVQERDIAVRMRQVRHAKKIAAAYRLGGISMLPCPDEEVLALRLDVAVEGCFVGCYHCFFDLVVYCEDEEEQANYDDDKTSNRKNDGPQQQQQQDYQAMLRLRLIQHTLPPSVPLASILENTMGGVASIGPFHNDKEWKTDELKERLQNCAKKLYQGCYCYAVRKHTASILKSFVVDDNDDDDVVAAAAGAAAKQRISNTDTNSSSSDDNYTRKNKNDQDVSFIIQDLQCSNRLDKLSFKLALVSGISSLQVTLAYKDPMRAQPTHVSVKNAAESASLNTSRTRRNQYYAAELMISDDDDEDKDDDDDRDGSLHDDLIENATVSFRRMPIRKALQEVSEAMAEW